MRIRRGLIGGLVLAAVAWSAGASAQAATHDPILFIHGWSRSSSDWSTMISRFTADGWGPSQLYTIDYDSSLSNKTIAEQVKQRVADIRAANGGAQVDVITHSMGGLSSRWYIKFLGGSADVEDWVSLGGPNHGTQTASGCLVITPVSCGEMLPGSSFLSDLNAGDETPGTVRYGTWWSPCDEVINPQKSVILQGATNTKTACISHLQLTQDATVYAGVRDFVR